MKLELKHIQSYPIGDNGVRFSTNEGHSNLPIIAIYADRTVCTPDAVKSEWILDDIKLELYSISNLAELIPQWKKEGWWCKNYSEWSDYPYEVWSMSVSTCPQKVFDKMVENHLDVYNLIGNNLAIEKT